MLASLSGADCCSCSSNLAPSPVLSRRLSFGTVDVDAEVVVSPKKARRPVATRGEAEASPEVEASTPSKRAGFKQKKKESKGKNVQPDRRGAADRLQRDNTKTVDYMLPRRSN